MNNVSLCIYLFILRISPYSVRMRENTDQNNSEYGHFLCNVDPSVDLCLHRINNLVSSSNYNRKVKSFELR